MQAQGHRSGSIRAGLRENVPPNHMAAAQWLVAHCVECLSVFITVSKGLFLLLDLWASPEWSFVPPKS